MTTFFARMADRATGRAAPLRVRPAQRFEPVRPVGPRRDGADTGSGAADLGLEVVHASPTAVPPPPEVPQPVEVPQPAEPGRDLAAARAPTDRHPGAVAPAGRAATAGARQPAPLAVPEGIGPRRAAAPIGTPAGPGPTGAPPSGPFVPGHDRPPAVAPPPERGPSPPVHGPTSPPHRDEADDASTGTASDGGDTLAAAPVPTAVASAGRADRPARRRQPGADGHAAPLPDLDDVVRAHVLPALVARGLVDGRDHADVVPETSRRPGHDSTPPTRARRAHGSRSGAVTVTTSPARRASPGPGAAPPPAVPGSGGRAAAPADGPRAPSGPPQVHVHIDRVVVSRPAPAPRAPAPPPAQRPRPKPDHDAYLARRREDR